MAISRRGVSLRLKLKCGDNPITPCCVGYDERWLVYRLAFYHKILATNTISPRKIAV